ncbi:MAG: cupin domain-containing protein [Gammaproteobacteria bacterium]
MDRSKQVAINTSEMDWLPSPAKGVLRKPLEREAKETGQVTSVVKYQPGSEFSSHMHPNGEEIFVLNGVFEDEHGSHPAGSYLRNPPGSSHAPKSSVGCELFVKLNMFQEGDSETVVINTDSKEWLPGINEGLSVMPLHTFGLESMALVKWKAGTIFTPHVHPGGEEIFVLEGTLEDEHGVYPKGAWIRSPNYSEHHPTSKEGCIIFVKTGHLPTL